ncbi:serine/threonine-protein phosphatase 6 regulatory ankyrin repeat subunit A-like [Gigantopelta aegis]|uniref:serine/threonine-protein phosphatase 6 regulatory ankyrin repeat subunit A-like n=1 Tax=Gigantopelta aegis TaxID=1735272 RepID=UPI001B88D282|nr:serine/threonine-protein phosphatase 6 regulatory ankyrin repeat subunit A-like [Gigantopelta aegis]
MKHLAEYILRTLNSNIYVTTRSHKKGETTLDDLGIVVLVGRPGSGKTTLGLYLMKYIRKIKQRQVLLLQHPSQFDKIQIPHNLMSATEKEKLVILIDDIFGRSNLIHEYVQKWELNFPRMWELAKAGLIKIIITCRSQIFQECENNLKDFDVFKKCHLLNLHDSEYCLTTDEKRDILNRHLKACTTINDTLSENERELAVDLTFTELGFPQCCSFYVNSPEAQKRGMDYFKNPIEYLKRQLDNIKLDKDSQFQYLVLLIIMFKRGTLKEDCLDPFQQDKETLRLINTLKNVCTINTGVSLGQIKTAAQSITGVYLEYNEINKSYSFIHQSVFDTLFLQFSGEFLKKSIEVCPVSMLLEYVVTPRAPTRSIVTVMVNTENDRFLAERPTDELKGTRHVEDETNVPNIRTILSHPSFKDEEFVNFLTEIVWNNEVPAEILNQKLDAQELDVEVAFSEDTLEKTWKYVGNRNKIILDDITVRGSITAIAISTSPGSLAVTNNLKALSSHFVSSLCKSDSSEFGLQKKEILDVACLVGNTEVVDMLLNSGIAPTVSSLSAAAASNTDDMEIFRNLLKPRNDLELGSSDLESMLFLALEQENGRISGLLIDELTKMGNNSTILEKAAKQLLLQCHRGFVYYVEMAMESKSSSRIGAGTLFRRLFSYSISLKPEVVVSLAAAHDDGAVLKEIVRANPMRWNTMKGDKSPLHIAAYYGCVDSVAILIEQGCNISAVSEEHQTALHLAAKHNTSDMVFKRIRCKCARFRWEDATSSNIEVGVASQLLRNGADVSVTDVNKNTALHIAFASADRLVLVKILVQNGTKVNTANKDGEIPLHIAATENLLEVVSYLVEQGSQINLLNEKGMSPLYLAQRSSAMPTAVCLYLLHKVADPNLTGRKNEPLLHLALIKRTLELTEVLVKNGASLSTTDTMGMMPLHATIKKRMDALEFVKCLVENGSSVNIENNGSTPLLLAITVKSFDVCLYLLDKRADPNVTDAEQNYPLHLAMRDDVLNTATETGVVTEKMNKHRGSPMEVVTRLVEKGAKLNVVDASGNTPLHIAAYYSSVDVVRYLVEKGLQIDLPNRYGTMPIHLASAHNTSAVCLCILDNGADPNITDADRKSPLHFAVCNREENVVETLIHHGAKLDNVDEFGNILLHIATKEGSLQTVSYLIDMKSEETLANDDVMSLFNLAVEHNTEDVAWYFLHKISDPNSVGNTEMNSPLHLAAKVHAPRLVKALVEGGASVNKKDRSGNTPLLATLQNYPKVEWRDLVECMTYLISNGSLVNVADHKGRTPLHLATSLPSSALDWSLVCVTYLVEHGSDINAEDDRGRTPLLLALMDHPIKISISLYLLDKGADPNLTDTSSTHPLHLAARKWVTPVLEALVEKGANVNVSDCSGNTPLHYMVQPSAERWIKYLIEKGSHINKVNNDGDTPLHIAAREGNPFIGFELLCRGADTNIINKANMTPLLLAADTSRSNLVDAILSKDKNVNIVDSSGEISLHKAVRQNRFESVKYLVMKGSDINLANSAGKTPLDLAEGEQCSDIREYLVAKGAYF